MAGSSIQEPFRRDAEMGRGMERVLMRVPRQCFGPEEPAYECARIGGIGGGGGGGGGGGSEGDAVGAGCVLLRPMLPSSTGTRLDCGTGVSPMKPSSVVESGLYLTATVSVGLAK